MTELGVPLAIQDHTMLLATWISKHTPVLTPTCKDGTQFTYPGGMEGW